MPYRQAIQQMDVIAGRERRDAGRAERAQGGGLRGFHERMKKRTFGR